MDRTCAAVGDQDEIARVVATADRHFPQRIRHLRINDLANAGRGLFCRQIERARDLFVDRPRRGVAVEFHLPAQEGIRVDDAEDHVGVRDGGASAAESIAGGAGPRAGAFRPHLELSVDEPSDRAAARPDCADFDHRRGDMKAASFMLGRH